jgi:hypothetical protein
MHRLPQRIHRRSARFSALVLLGALLAALMVAPSVQAQGMGPAPIQKMVSVLPDSLPGMDQIRARQSDPIGVTGVYERVNSSRPPRIDIRILYGQMALKAGKKFAQRDDATSTTLDDGRTLHRTFNTKEGPEVILLWVADQFVVSVESKESVDVSWSASEAKSSVPALERIFAEYLPPEQFAPIRSQQ